MSTASSPTAGPAQAARRAAAAKRAGTGAPGYAGGLRTAPRPRARNLEAVGLHRQAEKVGQRLRRQPGRRYTRRARPPSRGLGRRMVQCRPPGPLRRNTALGLRAGWAGSPAL